MLTAKCKTAAFLITFITLLSTNSRAQDIDSVLDVYANQFMPEKVHVHFDRSYYNSGETIYYKVYVLANDHLSPLSKIVYADWYDNTGKLLQQHELPLLLSSGKGAFEVPAGYTGNALHVKVYTKWMLNFDTLFIYSRSINIQQPVTTQGTPAGAPAKTQPGYTTMVQLYPEGGFAVAGLQNKFAYQAANQFGNPVNVHGFIKDGEGKLLDSTATVHDGMGAFLLLTETGIKYSFEWTDEYGHTGSTAIAAQKQSGATISLVNQGKQVAFTIQRTANAGESFKTMHLLIHRNEALHYKLDINMSAKAAISSKVALTGLPAGIIQFTLFNADWVPVAERVIFLNNQNQFFYPSITVAKKNLAKKGENEIEINTTDTSLANMSIAITGADVTNTASPGIFADLLLSTEIKGRVHNPGYYFSTIINHDTLQNNGQQAKTDSIIASHLDLVMLTHGHRLYNWEKITKAQLPQFTYAADTNYLQLKGTIKLKGAKDDQLLTVIMLTKDSSKSMFTIPVTKDGTFEKAPLIFYDTVKLFCSLGGKKSFGNSLQITLENTLLNRQERANLFVNKKVEQDLYSGDNNAENYDSLLLKQAYARKLAASATLKEVVVKAKTKPPLQVIDEYYTSGMFAGDINSYNLDVEGDIHSRGFTEIFSYIETKVPGFKMVYVNGDPFPVWYPASSGVPGPPAFFLDEVPITIANVRMLEINNIAYIKAIKPPFLGTMLNGFSGVIALYSKRGYSPVHNDDNSIGLTPALLAGFTKFREFIQPSYNDSTSLNQADYRPTLYWNPYILTDKNNQHVKLTFFNNDISKKICIILEGINTEGKLARVVKVIE